MPSVDQDCNTEFPHRSQVVINKKKYDEYCFKLKTCSVWNDTLKDDKNNPIPWPSECRPNTFKKMPIVKRGAICKSIKIFGSVEDIKTDLVDYKQLFMDISENYVEKYATWMKYPSDNNKKEVDKYVDEWDNLKKELIKERTKMNNISKNYTERVKGVSEILGRDRREHDRTTNRLKDAKKRLLSVGGEDMKKNMYNTTSGHIVQTIYYTTAIIVMGIFLTKLN
jgi:hypothetical protein